MNIGWNHGYGTKAQTSDGHHGGIALSGALFSRCDGKRIPMDPTPPSADFRDRLDAGEDTKQRTHEAILRSAARAALRGSARAFVLLENYRHRVYDFTDLGSAERLGERVLRQLAAR